MAEEIDIKKVVTYWKKEATQSFATAQYLYKGKRYSDCLFFCHLTIEKILKGLTVEKTKEHAPYIHELDSLAEKTKLNLSDEQLQNLKIITTFNIRARYDDIKLSFYKKCTAEYAKKYLETTNQLHLWLKKQFQTK